MKEEYIQPEIDVIRFEKHDVIENSFGKFDPDTGNPFALIRQ